MVGQQQKIFTSYGVFAGTGMEKNQDPGSGIFIPDPQHHLRFWLRIIELLVFLEFTSNQHSDFLGSAVLYLRYAKVSAYLLQYIFFLSYV